VVVCSLVIGSTVLYMHDVFTIGSPAVPAPQATLMATIITGLLNQDLPWGLVLVGVFIAVTLELCGVNSLSFAVGLYLPLAATAPIFAGGVVRWIVDRRIGEAGEPEIGAGTLFSSGLIAGGSIAGILFAVLVGTGAIAPLQFLGDAFPYFRAEGPAGQLASTALFVALGVIVYRFAMRKVE
jgi:uncharacterized oligopeptide transporter (OPT) family protein